MYLFGISHEGEKIKTFHYTCVLKLFYSCYLMWRIILNIYKSKCYTENLKNYVCSG